MSLRVEKFLFQKRCVLQCESHMLFTNFKFYAVSCNMPGKMQMSWLQAAAKRRTPVRRLGELLWSLEKFLQFACRLKVRRTWKWLLNVKRILKSLLKANNLKWTQLNFKSEAAGSCSFISLVALLYCGRLQRTSADFIAFGCRFGSALQALQTLQALQALQLLKLHQALQTPQTLQLLFASL